MHEPSTIPSHEQKVIRFDVTVDDVRSMQVIENRKHLLGKDHHNDFVQIATCIQLMMITNVEQWSIFAEFRGKYAWIMTDHRIVHWHKPRELKHQTELFIPFQFMQSFFLNAFDKTTKNLYHFWVLNSTSNLKRYVKFPMICWTLLFECIYFSSFCIFSTEMIIFIIFIAQNAVF